jgi:serine/threonine protein phosphatase 1
LSKFHLNVPRNRHGRDFVIGDLHGHTPALEEALRNARFMPGRDRLFSVGDLVDRGPDSPGAARLLKNPWFFAVRGNHEDMLLRVVDGEVPMVQVWRQNGGSWGLDGMQANAAAQEAAQLCMKMPWAITLHHKNGKRYGICHAQCPVDAWTDIESVENNPALSTQMLWSRDRLRRPYAPPVSGIDWTIHGHTIVSEVQRSANALFIETGVCMGGSLTLLCLDDFERDSCR